MVLLHERQKKAQAEDLEIQTFFNHGTPLEVPKYQRNYAWKDEEVTDFINDLKRLHRTFEPSFRSGPPAFRHFIGGVVCAKVDNPQSTKTIYNLLDGQQRIASIIIALSQIYHKYNEIAESAGCDERIVKAAKKQAKELFDEYLYYKNQSKYPHQNEYRIKLSKKDQPIFEKIINNENIRLTRSSPISHKLLKNAYTLIKEKLIDPLDKGSSAKEKYWKFFDLEQCIIRDLHVIHIKTDNTKLAYKIFMTLNDRGTSLTEGDLLKAFTLEILEDDPDKQKKVEERWEEILSMKSGVVRQFLKHYYISHIGNNPPKNELYDSYKIEIFNHNDEKEPVYDNERIKGLCKKISNLHTEFKMYKKMIEGKWPYETPTIKEWDQNRLNLLVIILKQELCMPL